MPRRAQPLRSQQLPFTRRVNGTVNGMVICVFHAPFTFPSQKIVRTPMTSHQVGVKENGSPWPELQELHPQILLTELTTAPDMIQAVKPMPMESLPCVSQKLQILGDRDDVLVVFPFLSDMKVAEDLVRCVRFERPL